MRLKERRRAEGWLRAEVEGELNRKGRPIVSAVTWVRVAFS